MGTASVTDRALAQNRYLVFTSRTDLIPTDTNGRRDIYWRDLRTGEMKVISRSSSGAQGNADSTDASISENGRYVVFRSLATNLVAGDGNAAADIFRRDLVTGRTVRVSVDAGGGDSNGPSLTPAISATGRYVVFASSATDLVASDSGGALAIACGPALDR